MEQRFSHEGDKKRGEKKENSRQIEVKYQVILKKVSFCVFSIILIFKVEKNFTVKSKDKVLSLSKFS